MFPFEDLSPTQDLQDFVLQFFDFVGKNKKIQYFITKTMINCDRFKTETMITCSLMSCQSKAMELKQSFMVFMIMYFVEFIISIVVIFIREEATRREVRPRQAKSQS